MITRSYFPRLTVCVHTDIVIKGVQKLVITGILLDMEAWSEKPIFSVFVNIMLTRIVSGCRKITLLNYP